MISPYDHCCAPHDLYYVGTDVECGVCGREWNLTPSDSGYLRFVMKPFVRYPPRTGIYEHQRQEDRRESAALPPDAKERLRRAASRSSP